MPPAPWRPHWQPSPFPGICDGDARTERFTFITIFKYVVILQPAGRDPLKVKSVHELASLLDLSFETYHHKA